MVPSGAVPSLDPRIHSLERKEQLPERRLRATEWEGTPVIQLSAANYWAYFNNLKRTGVLILTSNKPISACLLLLQPKPLEQKGKDLRTLESWLSTASCGGRGWGRKSLTPSMSSRRSLCDGSGAEMLTESSPSFWRTDDRSPYVWRMWVWVSGDSLSSLSGLPMGSPYSQSCTHRWDFERNPISWSEALGKGALKARKCRDEEREELETGSPWHWAWLLLTQMLSCATKAPARLMVSD